VPITVKFENTDSGAVSAIYSQYLAEKKITFQFAGPISVKALTSSVTDNLDYKIDIVPNTFSPKK
jgi:hypothetical protein